MTGRRRAIDLETWELLDTDPGTGGVGDWTSEGWIPVRAPGDTYQALIEAGRLAHPFQGREEVAAAWVRGREWWWRTSFAAPAWADDETIELVFEGLDTFAEVYLDGLPLIRTDNMFRLYVVEVGGLLRSGALHQLTIRFDPPDRAVPPGTLPVWSAFTDRVSRSNRNMMRKAQFGWGWDWGPDLPTVGVWRPARLEVRPRAAIAGVRFATTAVSADVAEARVEVELQGAPAIYAVEILLTDPQGAVVLEQTLAAGEGSLAFTVEEPQLWWTADLGDQPLYALTVRLRDSDRVIDETRRKVGLRTIALDESPDPDEPGTTFFRFVLNGTPIFAKGACWVPASSFVGDVDETAYRRLIAQTAAANMNMLRVWGGGIYEPDLFYDLCDELGVLVWQDFMFACAHYPEPPDFVESTRREVEDQVRRLRHHPCLAMWCGNNESQLLHQIDGDLSGTNAPLSGVVLYDELMPQVLARLDPETPYRPGSPWGGPSPNSMKAGDVHDWTVWHGVSPVHDGEKAEPFATTPDGLAFTRYAEDTARFVSEFGIQAAPALATLKRWVDEADLNLESPGFLARIRDEARKAEALMIPVTGLPKTLQQYVDFTQWTQAEGLKFGIEHFRRRGPHCSGALLWQLNDCWPSVSWSLIDYDGVEKAAYHAVRRAFAPVLASFATGEGDVELWITNDTLAAIEGQAVVTLETFDGRTIWRETLDYSAPSGGHAAPRPVRTPGPGQVLRVWAPDAAFPPNRLLPGPISSFRTATDTPPVVAISRIGPQTLRIDVRAVTYSPFVHIVSDRPDLRFSDNYFDLAAGDSRILRVTAATALGVKDVSVRWCSSVVNENSP